MYANTAESILILFLSMYYSINCCMLITVMVRRTSVGLDVGRSSSQYLIHVVIVEIHADAERT